MNIKTSTSCSNRRTIYLFNTGGPTKDATPTTTVQLLSTRILTNDVDCNSFLSVFTFTILFIHLLDQYET